MKNETTQGMSVETFFFTLFGIVCKIGGGKVLVDSKDIDAFKKVCDIMLIRHGMCISRTCSFGGKDFSYCEVEVYAYDLLERIASFFVRSFSNGKYRVPNAEDILMFKSRCHEMGLRVSFGRTFADAYKAYVSSVANWLFVSPTSIRASILESIDLNATHVFDTLPTNDKVDVSSVSTAEPSQLSDQNGERSVA